MMALRRWLHICKVTLALRSPGVEAYTNRFSVSYSTDAPIGIVAESFAPAPWLGLLGFIGAIVWLYGWMLRRSRMVVA